MTTEKKYPEDDLKQRLMAALCDELEALIKAHLEARKPFAELVNSAMDDRTNAIRETESVRVELVQEKVGRARDREVAIRMDAALRRDNDALRALLREARKAVESWTPDESNATESEMRELNRWYELRDHIDAALAGEKP